MTRQEVAIRVYDAMRPRVGVFLCDGYPRCDFAGTERQVREHRRVCSLSPSGDIYRAWMSVKP